VTTRKKNFNTPQTIQTVHLTLFNQIYIWRHL